MAHLTNCLFITYVDVDHDLLKIWGHQDRTCATYIEKRLWQLMPELNGSSGPNPSSIRQGMFCFAKYMDDNYYRARIISDVQGNSVAVLFIDCGNRDYVDISNIRVPDASGDNLSKIVAQAEEFILARVVAPAGGWTKEMLDGLRRDLCYAEFNFRLISVYGGQRVIQLLHNNDDYANILFRKGMAREVSVEKQSFIIHLIAQNMSSKPPRTEQGVGHFGPPSDFSNVNNLPQHSLEQARSGVAFHSSGGIQKLTQRVHQKQPYVNPPMARNVGHVQTPVHSVSGPAKTDSQCIEQSLNPSQKGMVDSQKSNFKPINSESGQVINSLNSVMIEALANELKQHLLKNTSSTPNTVLQGYVTQMLEVGQTYNVYVTYIDDGPWSFSVQLVSNEQELNKLMDNLAKSNLVPVKLPVVLGCPCIVKSRQDGNLYRGVVVNISHSAVKVFFVDFGNTEDVPVSSVFELPVKFFKTKALSQKFALSGLHRIKSSDDIKKAFDETVENELLILQVTGLEGDNLPTCELYLRNENIKRILNYKVRQSRQWQPIALPKQGQQEQVVVTWIESPQKFFVQLKKNETDLANLKMNLVNFGARGQRFSPEELVPGALCICCYSADNEWYRADIVSVNPTQDLVTVFYVDYGNLETVSSTLIRKVENESLVRQMCTQAVQCCLYGFENQPGDEETATVLENLVLEKELQLKVVYGDSERITVQLFDNGVDVSKLCVIGKTSSQHLTQCSGSGSKVDEKKINLSENRKGEKNKFSEHRQPSNVEYNPAGEHESRAKREAKSQKNERSISKYETRVDVKKNSCDTHEFNSEKHDHGARERYNAHSSKRKSDEGDARDRRRSERSSEKNWRGTSYNKESAAYDTRKKGNNHTSSEPKSSSSLGMRMLKAAKENELRGRKIDSEMMKLPVKIDRIVRSGSTFKQKTVPIGTTENVLVTYFLNPNEIYVQLLSALDKFRTMMDELQTYYLTKLPVCDTIKKGDIVVAKFGADGILYRAQVIETNPLTVRYADYGNEEEITRERLWPMDKKFLELETQCLKCSLPDVKPIDGTSWPSADSKMSEIFEFERYSCSFLRCDKDVCDIKLENLDNGKDVSDDLICSGYAARSKPDPDFTMDFSLMSNETFNVYISHIVDPSQFFVHVNSDVLNGIEEKISQYRESQRAVSPVDSERLTEGMMCLSTVGSDKWIRAEVVEKTKSGALLYSVDYGYTLDRTFEQIATIPNVLEKYSPQAVECCLLFNSNEIPSDVHEEFKTCIDKRFIALVNEVTDSRLKITLYDLDGSKLNFMRAINDAPVHIPPVVSLPIVSQGILVTPVYIMSCKEIYVTLSRNGSVLDDMNSKLAEFYCDADCPFAMGDDESFGARVCAAKSLSYDCWYRAIVQSLNKDSAKVFYIDYGNSEELPLENIKNLDSQFWGQHELVKKVSLKVDFNEDNLEEINNKLCQLILEKECIAHFSKAGDDLFAEFVIGNSRVTDLLMKCAEKGKKCNENKSEGVAGEKPTPAASDEGSECKIETSEKDVKVFISHVCSPNEFWIQESVSNELEAFQNNFQEACLGGSVKKDVRVGDIVGAHFTDGHWYRAKINNIEEENLSVEFIDYGYSLKIDAAKNEIRELPAQVLETPPFARCCSLKGNWKEGATARLEEIITEHQDPFTLVKCGEEGRIVDLLKNKNSITEQLIAEGFSDAVDAPIETETVFICHINSPNDFYIHREGDKPLLERICDELRNAHLFEDAVAVEDYGLYCAKGDDAWYRSRVMKRNGNETEVYSVDYGVCFVTQCLKEIPVDLRAVPGLALNCCLIYGESVDTWSERACSEFMRYLKSVKLKVEIVLAGTHKSVVKLFTENGQNLTEKLEPLCEEDGRAEIYVTHVNSPGDFYIQMANDENYNAVSEALRLCDNFDELPERKVGVVCASKYEGEWYRAEIKDASEDSCELLYIDYGNKAPSSELKKLPEEIERIPPLAKNCSLNFSVTNIPESIKEEFINLTRDGETVFRCRVIKPGERDIVSLIVDGQKLEEVLLFSISKNSEIYNISLMADSKNYVSEGMGEAVKSVAPRNAVCSISDYEDSNFERAPTRNSVVNETDEEKRVKFAISTAEYTEGFKSDDEKGVLNNRLFDETEVALPDRNLSAEAWSDGVDPLAEVTDAPDSEVNETEEREYFAGGNTAKDDSEVGTSPESSPDAAGDEMITLPNGVGNVKVNLDDDDGDRILSVDQGENPLTAEGVDDREDSFDVEGAASYDRNCTKKQKNEDKIVPGCISRGDATDITVEEVKFKKLPYSERILPGCIARGASLEEVSVHCEESRGGEVKCESVSAPVTPAPRRKCTTSERPDHSERLLPSCVSGGSLLGYKLPSEAVVHDDKIVSAAVNGTGGEVQR